MLVGPRHERQMVRVGAAAFAKLARYHRYYLGQGSDGRIPAGHVVAAVPVKGMETDHQLVIMIYRFEVSPTRFVIGPLQPAEHKGGLALVERTALTSSCIPAVWWVTATSLLL